MTTYVFGANGMLGRYVQNEMEEQHVVVPLNRDDFDLAKLELLLCFLDKLGVKRGDIVVNCAAILKCRIKEVGIEEAITVNSLFPHALSGYCEKHGIKLIHISTDCVFGGRRGGYAESDEHDAFDEYGKTKSLGEPGPATVIRTSIVGEEIGQKRSLLEWVRSQNGVIKGFVDCRWNGVTCYQLAKIIQKIIDKDLFWRGARHIFSPDTVNKYQLVSLINEIYDVGLVVSQYQAE